ncbi:MAG: ATP-dependent helicase HrpB [Sinobacteraceae bacterium]|nr:ATP-dependent helicase HrpB [Nevskiaceae bacterium]
MPELPILSAVPELRAALREASSAVIEAPPGAGKSTVVPLALLEEPWLRGRKILMLEPRRLAARAVAQRMASTLGEQVGGRIGYRMRLDTRVSRQTRIEVVTEGVLTRLLQDDPALEEIGLVIFDEFHERSLQADLGLALCLDARTTLGLDLRVLVMSATLDGVAVAELLAEPPLKSAPLVRSMGRSYPVEIVHLGRGLPSLPGGVDPLEREVALAIRRALREQEGDILVFLPGAGEIRRVESMLRQDEGRLDPQVEVFPLYGELDPAAQDAALAESSKSARRIILATNIAETSLTLPRIRVVIDSGLVRRAAFDPVSGMSRLETRRISCASADQRAGRAGRVAAGVCYRLWGAGAERTLAAYTPAEMLEADLMPLALDLACWGAAPEGGLRWLDAPPVAVLGASRDLLRKLGALDAQSRITDHGKAMARWAVHPRLAHLLLESELRGAPELGARLAALLSERDVMRRDPQVRDTDIRTRLELLDGDRGGASIDRGALARARRLESQFAARLRSNGVNAGEAISAGGLLACAYPDRIGKRRPGSAARYLLANGRGAIFAEAAGVGRSEYIVAIDLDDAGSEARVQLAASIDAEELKRIAGARVRSHREVRWSMQDECVLAREIVQLDALVLSERLLTPVPPDEAALAMIEGIAGLGLQCLPWDEEAQSLCARIELARRKQLPGTAEWPSFASDVLSSTVGEWLSPWLEGITRRSHLKSLPLLEALRFRLGATRLRQLDEWFPSHLTVPTGSRIRIDYCDDLAPCASMRMQEVFGLASTPRLAGGQVPVTFKLLSPAQRPLQVTADLASFWRNAYTDVRKDMRGRYPRHYWPEDPLQAEPTRRVRPRS